LIQLGLFDISQGNRLERLVDGRRHIVIERAGGSEYESEEYKKQSAKVAEASKSAVITSWWFMRSTFG
jgi:hypothetical protein